MTMEDNKKSCILPNNIFIPNEMKKIYRTETVTYDVNVTSNYSITDPQTDETKDYTIDYSSNVTSNYDVFDKFSKPDIFYRYINDKDYKNKFCEDKWYEWFSIPDYHLGNNNNYSTDDDKCYAKCKLNYIPFSKPDSNDDGEIDKQYCVLKDEYMYGIYKGSLPYIPISLIFLLGSTKDFLIQYYLLLLKNKKSDITNYDFDKELYEHISTNVDTQNNIYNSAKINIKAYIDEFLLLPIDEKHIIEPSDDIAKISNVLMDKPTLTYAYDMCKKMHDILNNDIEYNNWKRKLLEVTEYTDFNDWRLNKQIVFLKKASNILFNGKSNYSTDIVLYTLNKNSDIIRNAFEFDLNFKNEIKQCYSQNSAYNSSDVGKEEVKITEQPKPEEPKTGAIAGGVADISDITDVSELPIDESTEIVSDNYDESSRNLVSGPLLAFMIITRLILIIIITALSYFIFNEIYKKIKKELNAIINIFYLVFKLIILKITRSELKFKIDFLEHRINNISLNINNIKKLIKLVNT
jgi:hypothetical protein